jgi:hypothetical protein
LLTKGQDLDCAWAIIGRASHERVVEIHKREE